MVLSWSIGQISQVFITSREFLILPPIPTSSLQSQRSFITFLVKTYSSVVTARTVSPPTQRPECKLWVVKYKNTHNILKLNRPRLTRLSKKKKTNIFFVAHCGNGTWAWIIVRKNCLNTFTRDWADHKGSLHAYSINQKEDGFAH